MRSIVLNLKDNVNAGPDNIFAYFVKRCWSAPEQPILSLFNKMLSTGRFPAMWKFSYILPIYKSGNKHDISNYRLISTISCIAKIFDAFIANELSDILIARLADQ